MNRRRMKDVDLTALEEKLARLNVSSTCTLVRALQHKQFQTEMSKPPSSVSQAQPYRSTSSSCRIPQPKSLISIVGDPIPGERRNTEDSLGVLVQMTSGVTESQMQKALENYIDGSQAPFHATTTNKSPEWIQTSQLNSLTTPSAKENKGIQGLNHNLTGADLKLVGPPQTSSTRNTIDFMNYMVRVSLDQGTEKKLRRAILKNEEDAVATGKSSTEDSDDKHNILLTNISSSGSNSYSIDPSRKRMNQAQAREGNILSTGKEGPRQERYLRSNGERKRLFPETLSYHVTTSDHSATTSLKETRSVEFEEKPNEVYTYTPDREQSMRQTPGGDVSNEASDKSTDQKNKTAKRTSKPGFFAPCCCCCKNRKTLI